MRFPGKKNTGCPKASRGFPPRKDGILHPLPVELSWNSPPPPPGVCTGGRAYADVTTKISRIDRLPNLLRNAAPLGAAKNETV